MSFGRQEKARRYQLLKALMRMHSSDVLELRLSEPARQALVRLLSSQSGGARRRLERAFIRQTPDSDWQLIDEFIGHAQIEKQASMAAEKAILKQRNNLIGGCADTLVRVSECLSEPDVIRLNRAIT